MGGLQHGFPRSPSVWASWRLRIGAAPAERAERADGVLGAGILLSERLALTCAHVLPHRDAAVVVEFPECAGDIAPTTGRVAENGWRPPTGARASQPGGDVALLVLDPPRPQARPAPLRRATPYYGRTVRMCGYPENLPEGHTVRGVVAGAYGDLWIQLDPVQGQAAVRPGFSGAAVTADAVPHGSSARAAEDVVLGMIVSDYGGPAGPGSGTRLRHSYMIPVERIVDLVPQVARYATGPSARAVLLPSPRAGAAGGGRGPVPDRRVSREVSGWLAAGRDAGPSVKLVPTASEPHRDVAVRQALSGALVSLDATGRTAEALVDEFLERLAPPPGYERWLRARLLPDGSGPPGHLAPQDAEPSAARPDAYPNVAVYGIDAAARPFDVVDVLARLRAAQRWRMLAVLHDPAGEVWRYAQRRLLVPALWETAWARIDLLGALEGARRRRRPSGGGPWAGPDLAEPRSVALVRLGGPHDPHTDVQQLADFVRRLREDIDRLGAEGVTLDDAGAAGSTGPGGAGGSGGAA